MRLLAVSKLINQAVGDALSGLLLVEVILQHMGWSIHRWNELYHDLPSRQLKVNLYNLSFLKLEIFALLSELESFFLFLKYQKFNLDHTHAHTYMLLIFSYLG